MSLQLQTAGRYTVATYSSSGTVRDCIERLLKDETQQTSKICKVPSDLIRK